MLRFLMLVLLLSLGLGVKSVTKSVLLLSLHVTLSHPFYRLFLLHFHTVQYDCVVHLEWTKKHQKNRKNEDWDDLFSPGLHGAVTSVTDEEFQVSCQQKWMCEKLCFVPSQKVQILCTALADDRTRYDFPQGMCSGTAQLVEGVGQ